MCALIDRQDDVLDPNVLQRRASDPDSSVWVSASAGTGKTKVLTDRVLRLLLPRLDGRVGTAAQRILCLTFTKAAANEMALRVQNTLGQWAIMSEFDLRKELESLMGCPATDVQYHAAKRLFAENIDQSSGLRIMTIHSFCQSVLGRFPLEAGLLPNFTVLDDWGAQELVEQAQSQVLDTLLSVEMSGSVVSCAAHYLLAELEEKKFFSLVTHMCAERSQIENLYQKFQDFEAVRVKICNFYGVDAHLKVEDVLDNICKNVDEKRLRCVAQALLQDSGKKGVGYGRVILNWLDASIEERTSYLQAYQNVFLTTKNDLRVSGFPTKQVKALAPESEDILRKEARRLQEGLEQQKSVRSARITTDLLIVGYEILQAYGALKRQRSALDFDDLVIYTKNLLENQSAWVMYKLDEGLDHLLVDEAQDTNPEQWDIVEALCSEFFDGHGAFNDISRTSFTVGDIKQSIYSFQRAAPAEFKRVQNKLDEKIKNIGKSNRNIELDISFRSTRAVLNVVDRVFENADLQKAVGGVKTQHISYRSGQAGRVELWPLFETQKVEPRDPWALPVHMVDHKSASVQLADYIAQSIKNWLDRNEVIESYGRVIEPGDIMILVRTRNAFVEQLTRALKQAKIPVSGSDRMALGEQMAVQDLLNLARFCVLPQDDLALAGVLKSPFIGMNEDDIFSLCYGRKGTLWEEICNFDRSKLADLEKEVSVVSPDTLEAIRVYLSELIGRVQQMSPYEFFSYVLNRVCLVDERSGFNAMQRRLGHDVWDSIEEFLSEALVFGDSSIEHMQLFIEEQERTSKLVKREMDNSGGHVRIMTIHGAKGLQAPIVILPDTILNKGVKKPARFLWPDKSGLDVPIYSAHKGDDSQKYSDLYSMCEVLDEEEYYRLLYVAMTRAEDRLYICGYSGVKGGKEGSWYYHIRHAMERDRECNVLEGHSLRIDHCQSGKPDRVNQHHILNSDVQDLPKWALSVAPEEPLPPRPLVPSRSSEDEILISPLISGDQIRFHRGNITHKLLQFLPDIDFMLRKNAAEDFVQNYAVQLSEDVRHAIVTEVIAVLNHEDYTDFFAKGSIAEVPVTGLMKDGRIVSGQIDRLVVRDDEIWILDYKSNRPPPDEPKKVQTLYKNQLRAYRDSIEQIYPGRLIHCALLWTDGPRLMIMDDYL